jgi:NAD-dependent dihydropyrimidine dehydrogenase PreA subunit
MPHIICEPCIGVKDRACVDVCPVECIRPIESEDRGEVQLFIHPDECIDCGACQFVQCRQSLAKTTFQTSGLAIPRRTRIISAWI